MICLSILLAGTIAEPVRRWPTPRKAWQAHPLARRDSGFTRRRDEIGPLSACLRDMTMR